MEEPPYGAISRLLNKGEVIPFLGAGASLSGRPAGAHWSEKDATFLPTGRELAEWLADDSQFPEPDPSDRDNPQRAEAYYLAEAERSDLAKVSSFYTRSVDRLSLISLLHDAFDRDYQIGEVHRFLAEVNVPLLIVTTNYDDLIERAFRAKNKAYHLVTYPTDNYALLNSVLWWKPGASEPESHEPNKLPLSLTDTSIIYKMHGSVDRRANIWDSFVITEEDYVDFLSRMTGGTAIPMRFMTEFKKRRFLFLGYGLRDWNLRVMLRNLKTALGGSAGPALTTSDTRPVPAAADLRAWVIQRNPSALEQKLWEARTVNIYDMDLDAFVQRLRASPSG